MLGITDYGAFVACAIMLNLTPGTDTVYVISRSIAGGRKPGAVSALGISTGILMHTVLCASGQQNWDDALISDVLTDAYQGMRYRYLEGSNHAGN